MNNFLKIILIFALLAPVGPGWDLAAKASAADNYVYYPHYYVAGSIEDKDSKGTAGRDIIFYENEGFLKSNIYVANKTADNWFAINVFAPKPSLAQFAAVKKQYFVFIKNDKPGNPAIGYGADPQPVTLSGKGVDLVSLKLVKGAGTLSAGDFGMPPRIENIKFGNRLYQRAMVEKGEKFIISAKPKISAKVVSDFGINSEGISILVNEKGGPTAPKSFAIKEVNMSNVVKSTAVEPVLKSLTFSYDVPEENKLGEGTNTLKFLASNMYGSTEESVTVTVMSGPLSVIGQPLTFPSPFSPSKDKLVTIQYGLSGDGDIDILLVSGAGRIVAKISCTSGTEGGSAGVNKVTWNGVMGDSKIAGNGVYSGAIVSRVEGRVLARFKLTVMD